MTRVHLLLLMGFVLSAPGWAGGRNSVDYDDLAIEKGTSEAGAQASKPAGEWTAALRRAGVKDPARLESLDRALSEFLGAFTPTPNARHSKWNIRSVAGQTEAGATVRVVSTGYSLANFPMIPDMQLVIESGHVRSIARFRIRMRAADLSSRDARVSFCPPGGLLTVPVDPDTSRTRLEEGFREMGFTPAGESAAGTLKVKAPGDGKGLLLIDATQKSQVWTAGTLVAEGGVLAYQQRIVVYEGSIPRTFRSIVEGKVNDAISESFRNALGRIGQALAVRFTLLVDAIELDSGSVVVDGHGEAAEASGSDSGFGKGESGEDAPRSDTDDR